VEEAAEVVEADEHEVGLCGHPPHGNSVQQDCLS
jgi:hypothetical protein